MFLVGSWQVSGRLGFVSTTQRSTPRTRSRVSGSVPVAAQSLRQQWCKIPEHGLEERPRFSAALDSSVSIYIYIYICMYVYIYIYIYIYNWTVYIAVEN